MTLDLRLLVYSVFLTWVMLLTSSLLRSQSWTPAGLKLAFGNRDDLPEPSPAAARADRAAKNMLENLVLFGALLLTAHAAGVATERLEPPARLFFYARLAYFPLYVAGIPYLRTAAWAAGVAALVMIGATMLA
jgi:uncharacterized MAPEG superfamily protein